MNRTTFLNELRNNLSSLEASIQQDIINDYIQLFNEKNNEGIDDSTVIQSMESPKDIAAGFLDELNSNQYSNSNSKHIIKFLLLQITNVLFIIPILIGIYSVLFSLLIAASGAFAAFAVFYSGLNFITNITIFFLLIGSGILLLNLSLILLSKIFKLTKKYFFYNIKLLRGEL